MEKVQQSLKTMVSFKNATILVCVLNLITALFLLHGFLSSSSSSTLIFNTNQPDSVKIRYIKESEEIRRSLEPLELIKRVREIEKEAYVEQEPLQQKDAKQSAAADLISRLNNVRSYSDAGSQKGMCRRVWWIFRICKDAVFVYGAGLVDQILKPSDLGDETLLFFPFSAKK